MQEVAMLTMAVGHSDDVDASDAIAAAITQCKVTLAGTEPQAGILFAGFDGFDPGVVATIREAFPSAHIVGCTSSAELSSLNGYQEGSLALAMLASDTIDMTVGIGTGLGRDVGAACHAAVDHALAASEQEPRICIALMEGFTVDPQQVLDGLAEALPEGVVILGGTSARNDFAALIPTWQFCDEVVSSDAVAVLLFSGPVTYSMAVGTGWRLIGPVGRVTRSEYGAIHEIDGLPASDFLARYLDVTGPAAFGNPLSVREQGTDESYLRAISGADPVTGTVNLAGSIPVGSAVQLTTGDTDQILSGAKDALARASATFPPGSTPDAGFIFSCAVRKFVLGSRTSLEAGMARSALGSTLPLAGMYCFGEIGPIRGAASSRYLNQSFVTLLLGA